MYEDFYQLSAKPFQVSPDPRFFYGSKAHKRAMSYLRYGLSQGEGFVVITGGVGTGKTTLIRNLFADLGYDDVIAAQLVTSNLQADEMLKMISSAFNLPTEGLSKAALLHQFEAFLRQADREGRRILLVVDEAQNLPPSTVEELRMLSNFQIENRPLLQSFLLGQDEFRHIVQSPNMEQLRQRIIASCHLTPLDQLETRAYIEHRLKLVGWRGDNPEITDSAFDEIHRHTQGVPRRINSFCDRLLLYGYLEEVRTINSESVAVVERELAQENSVPRPLLAERYTAPQGVDDDDFDSGTESVSPRTASLSLSEIDKRIHDIEYVIEALEKNFNKKIGLLKSVVHALKSTV